MSEAHLVWPWWNWILVVPLLVWAWWRRPRWLGGIRRFRRPRSAHGPSMGKATVYRGQEYPSRVQAQWARWLYEHRVAYEAEPEWFRYDLGNGVFYRPDFWLPTKRHWMEVKYGMDQLTPEVFDKARRLAKKSGQDVQLVVGWPEKHQEFWVRAREVAA